MSWQRPETFEEWWERFGQPYEAAVIEGNGVPWAEDSDKRRPLLATLGLPDDTEPMALRRALWERRYRTNTKQETAV